MDGKVIGWFQGRMEFGQRALGNRSILADPRNANMQKDLNLKIKFRESFRPFAPSILLEDLSSWFSLGVESLYMQYVAKVLECKSSECNVSNDIRSKIPAVVHVDGSARIQTVTNTSNRKFYSLLKSFKNKTGCPMLVNTSFNVRGEPIVESPLDAFKCFMNTDMDMLVIGNFICHKDHQNANIKFEKNEFPAD
jgi:carbamoyltransferase